MGKSRVISFIDRRDKTKKDSIFTYVPPINCRNIPNNAVDEWYLNSSKTCLLPGDENKAQKFKFGTEYAMKELKNANIGSSDRCEGGLLTLSFIAKEEDAIK